MTERLTPPDISPGIKLYGPPSYFRSMEQKYGEPIQKWIDIADDQLAAGVAHMKVVEYLKAEYGMGHGHANAVVGWVKEQRA